MTDHPTDTPGDGAFRASNLHSTMDEMSFAGATSFMRRRYSRDLTKADVAIVGVPFDGGVTNRPGCRFGPRAIRAASSYLSELDPVASKANPLQHLNIVDYGDCYLHHGNHLDIAPTIRACAEQILTSKTHMIAMGGDHFITYPLLEAHSKHHGAFTFLQFDAHCDTWPDDGVSVDHGTMFLRALRQGLIRADRWVQVGIRTRGVNDDGITQVTAPWIHQHGVDATVDIIRNCVRDGPCYLSFDIDCLDPAFAPGTGTPVCGGLSSWQTIAILRGLQGTRWIGMDLVEVSPAYDHAEMTSLAAATMMQEYLCLLPQ